MNWKQSQDAAAAGSETAKGKPESQSGWSHLLPAIVYGRTNLMKTDDELVLCAATQNVELNCYMEF